MRPPFRNSEFIDFNTGTVKIDPMTLQRMLPVPRQRTDNLRLFECRVDVWHLGVAVQLLREIECHHDPTSIWCHSAYGLIAIVFSYFEMIGKTLNPESAKSGTAGTDFNVGFCDVYPEFKSSSGRFKDLDMPVVRAFRDLVRNGMYHLAYTKNNLIIHNCPDRSPKDFDVKREANGGEASDKYLLNPHGMTRTIVAHFPTFIQRVREAETRNDDNMASRFDTFFKEYHEA